MKTSTFLLFITYLTPTLATLQYYLAKTLPDSQCTTHIVPSKNTCCSCNQSNCPESFGQACGDDVSGNVCPGKQILRVADDSPGAFAGSTLINTALCGAKGLCYEQKWLYEYTCCACPKGYLVMSEGNCDTGAYCVGCTEENETLTKDENDPWYSCVLNS